MKIKKRLRKGGKASYDVKVYVAGERRHKSFRDLGEAKRWGRSMEEQLTDGVTFAGLVTAYERDLPRLSLNTQRSQASRLKFWLEILDKTPVRQVTPEMIDAGIARLRESGKGAATINGYRQTLGALFNHGLRVLRCLDRNPCEAVSLQRVESAGRQYRWLTASEIEALRRACRESASRSLFLMLLVAMDTGARFEEVRTLTWSQVEWERTSVAYGGIRGERRMIQVSGEAMEELQRLHLTRRPLARYVFSSPHGDNPIDCRRSWEGAVERAGLSGLRPIDIQATAIDLLYRGGASLDRLAKFIGRRSAGSVRALLSPDVDRFEDIISIHGRGEALSRDSGEDDVGAVAL